MADLVGHVDLARQFVRLAAEDDSLSGASYLRAEMPRDPISWKELLTETLVVILSEAGSGKSWEMRETASVLRAKGVPAYRLDLTELLDHPIDFNFSSDEQALLRKWRRSNMRAHFFLDSIDEAKLVRVDDFYRALKRFANALGPDLSRASIVLSTRPNAWLPQRDSVEILRLFGTPLDGRRTLVPKLHNGHFIAGQDAQVRNDEQSILVVRMLPLDRQRVLRFAEASIGKHDAEKFAAGLDAAYAWDFARRPYDVFQLLQFWRAERRLGTLTELIDETARSALEERSPNRSISLSPKRARDGTVWLAIQTRLSRREDIVTIEHEQGRPGSGAEITLRSCLPEDWGSDERAALLSRPIFEPAAYGLVRFHHRRTAEYLASEWVATWMDLGGTTDALRSLLFHKVANKWRIKGSLAPITAWAAGKRAPWAGQLREWILEYEPGIHLSYGDPAALKPSYRKALLKQLVERTRDRQFVETNWEAESLARLGGEDIAPDIAGWLVDNTVSEGLRCDYLSLVRFARLKSCMPAALVIVEQDAYSKALKVYALAALRDVSGNDERKRLAAIVHSWPLIAESLLGTLVEALYPEVWSEADLADAFGKSEAPAPYSIGAGFVIRAHLAKHLSPSSALALLPLLCDLVSRPPHLQHSPLSVANAWMADWLPTVIVRALDTVSLSETQAREIANGLQLLHHVANSGVPGGYVHLDETTLRTLRGAVDSHEMVKYRCFDIVRTERIAKDRFCLAWQIRMMSGSITHFGWSDVGWLLRFARDVNDREIQQLMLTCASEWLWEAPSSQLRTGLLFRVLANLLQSGRLVLAMHAISFPIGSALNRWWQQNIRMGILQDYWRNARLRESREKVRRVRERYHLWRHIRDLSNGKRADWLVTLARIGGTNVSRFADIDWNAVSKERGRAIASAVRRGCERSWRGYRPELPHEKKERNQTSGRSVIGLIGLESEHRHGTLDFVNLSPIDAENACRYACSELNDFPEWAAELATTQPIACTNVLSEAIRGEWKSGAAQEFAGDILSRLRSAAPSLAQLVAATVRSQLDSGDPQNLQVLDHALYLADKLQLYTASEWATIAAQRVAIYATVPNGPVILWLGIWLQAAPDNALLWLDKFLGPLQLREQDDFVTRLLSGISSAPARMGKASPSIQNACPFSVMVLEKLIRLAYRHVRVGDDINRSGGGAYSSTPRDDAQKVRSQLLAQLGQHADPDSLATLEHLATVPELNEHRDWVMNLIEGSARRLADGEPLEPKNVHQLFEGYASEPRNDRELFSVAVHRLADLKLNLEESENSPRREAQKDWKEKEFQRWVQRKLDDASRGNYIVASEEETDDGFADLRFLHSSTGSVVPTEMKWAESWTYQQLVDALRDQLVGKYLRPYNRRHGLYVLGYIGKQQHWQSPDGLSKWTFNQVVDKLRDEAELLVTEKRGIDGLEVVSLNFVKP